MSKLKFFTGRWSLKDSSQEPSEPHLKRKEQVRRAQKNYRRRKEDYVKDLEAEVVHLRTCKSDLLGETQKLSEEIKWLRGIIDENHITLPPISGLSVSSSSHYTPPSSTATVHVGQDQFKNRRIIVQQALPCLISNPDANHHGNNCSHPGPVWPQDIMDRANGNMEFNTLLPPESGLLEFEDLTATVNINNASHISCTDNENNVVNGMNFILSLEGPCLEHVRCTLQSPDVPNGHALTLTASIFRLCGDPALSSKEDQSLQMPERTLGRLLELSSQLTEEDEFTPSQVWACVCQHPRLAKAKPDRIMSIAKYLLNYVKCYGFGAVVPRTVVMSTLSQALSSES